MYVQVNLVQEILLTEVWFLQPYMYIVYSLEMICEMFLIFFPFFFSILSQGRHLFHHFPPFAHFLWDCRKASLKLSTNVKALFSLVKGNKFENFVRLNHYIM